MTDYAKLKNADLEALLKERNLPHGGKKADMVARLVEHDKTQTGSAPASAPAPAKAAPGATADEDEIDFDDDEIATTEPAAAAVAAGGAERAKNPAAVPNQAAAVDPAKTSDLTAAKDTSTSKSAPLSGASVPATAAQTADAAAAAAKPAVDFSSNMPATSLDAELAKRKARAAKFGIAETDTDAIKAIERAKRFGTGTKDEAGAAPDTTTGVKRLDEALPERRKRGRPGADDAGGDEAAWEDEGLLKRRRGTGGRRVTRGRRRGGGRGGGVSEGRVQKDSAAKEPRQTWMSDADRQKAEARKARWAVPAS